MTDTLNIITDQTHSSPYVTDFEWTAVWEDYDGAPDAPDYPVGYGRTESDAKAQLIESTIDTDFDDGRIEAFKEVT